MKVAYLEMLVQHFVSEQCGEGMKVKMLSKPNAGWRDFIIGDKLFYLSYVPEDWLSHAICGLETNTPFVVYSNCESKGEIYCIVDYRLCTVLWVDDHDEKSYVIHNFGMMEFCQRLHACIREDIDDWALCWPIPSGFWSGCTMASSQARPGDDDV